MAALRSNMAQVAQMAGQGFAAPKLATVTSYDPDHYAVKVQLQPPPADGDAPETGWLPVWSPWIGNQWGFFSPPNVGDQVLVLFQDGDGQLGLCLGGIFSDVDRPLDVPAKEFWLQHELGSFLKFTNDKAVLINAAGNLNITVVGNVNLGVTGSIASQAAAWTHTGPLHVTENITCDKTVTATTDVVGGGKSLKTHLHSGVTGGSSNTGAPV